MNEYMKLYNEDAKNGISEISLSGRRDFLAHNLKLIVPDVVSKLDLKPTDSLLDIGCNCGEVTIPLSFLCDSVTGVDGDELIKRLKARCVGIKNIDTISGDFMEVEVPKQFDCILIYSVLVYMDSYEEKLAFIKKALTNLKPGGRMLVGDIINSSVKDRFNNSELGKKINESYKLRSQTDVESDDNRKAQNNGPELKNILTDESLMQLLLDIRREGYESFLLPQNFNMAFGCTRQDILIKAW